MTNTTINSNISADSTWLMPAIPNAHSIEIARIGLTDENFQRTGNAYIIAVEWLEKRAIWNVMTVSTAAGRPEFTMLASRVATNPNECDEAIRIFIGSAIQSCPAGYEIDAYFGPDEGKGNFPVSRAFLVDLDKAQQHKERLEFAVGKSAVH